MTYHRLRLHVRVPLMLLALAVSSRATALPSGFQQTVVVNGLSNATAMQFAPDGRLFVCQQTGQLRVIKNGSLLPTPFLNVTVDSSGERGLLGVAFDPSFASNHFVYVYYTATTPAVHNRISRFTANGDVAVAGSEVAIFDLDNLSGATNHNGGALTFGPDGKLYAAVGENANGANSQSFNNVLGKILRINSNGTIPTDNPFFTTATGKNRAIWALGLRNPFTFAFNPVGNEMYINDVGQNTWEEIDNGMAGANYGWPDTEGATSDPRYVTPLYSYNHAGGECAITGGAFYAPLTTQFPGEYVGDYFFADYCGGWIRSRDTSSGAVATFTTGFSFPVDLKVGDDGSLYVLARGSGAVYKIQYVPSEPAITSHPSSQTVAAGSPVTFSVRATSTSPIRYQWQRNAADISGATGSDYTIASVATGDNGARFRAVVSNDFSSVLSNEAVLTVAGGGAGATLFTTQTPVVQNVSDLVDWEMGVRVRSDVTGQITALRFWKGSSENGVHTGHVWTAAGQLLATVTFTNETASGWQQQMLPSPVAMLANTDYVVSVTTPANQNFVVTFGGLAVPVVNGHLRSAAGDNGVLGPAGTFPTRTFNNSNYFRDLVFVPGGGGGSDTTPPTVSMTQPTANSTVSGSVTITATSGDDVGVAGLQFRVDGVNIGSEVPTPSSPYSIVWDSTTVGNGSRVLSAVVRDAAGHSTTASVTVMVANAVGAGATLFTTQTPVVQNVSDLVDWEMGVRVRSDVTGQITALRFWKGSSENGVHTGHVWTAAGQLLATVTFTNETASGWQQQMLPSPVAMLANTDYVVSVTTPANQNFVVTFGGLAVPVVNGHLRSAAGDNGVLGPAGTFPTRTFNNSNYFRDLVFVPDGGGSSSSTFPLKLGNDLRHLVDQADVPFLINGEAAWSLVVGLQKPDVSMYLADRRAKGFNTLLVELIEHRFSVDPPKNAYGDGPFTIPGDFSTPNESYFAHADWVISEAASRGMLVLLTPAYLGFGCGGEGWCQEMNANGAAKLFNYGVYVGNRYKNFKNIIWVHGGDANANAYPGTGDIMRAVINGIKSVDGPRVHTSHCGPGASGLDCYDEAWLDVNTTYASCNVAVARTRTDYDRARVMPFFFIEGTYENEGASDVCLRSLAYWSILGGSIGHVFGNNPIWKFGPGWQQALNSTGARSMASVAALFGSRLWQTLVPDYLHQVVTAGYGNINSATYVPAARTADGRMAIAYLPSGGTITVDMSRLSGPATARWYDPVAGTFTPVAGSPFANTGSRDFTTSGTNAGGSVDWVLLLEVAPA